MDEVTLIKNKIRQEQWEKLITERQNSGLTIIDWCKKNNISCHAYYYWLRKLRKKACNHILSSIPEQKEPQIAFAKVDLQPQQTIPAGPVIIHLPSATIEVYNGANTQIIDAVLMALKNIC